MKKFLHLDSEWTPESLRIRWASGFVPGTVFLMVFGSPRKSVRNLWCTDLLVEVEAHLEFDKMPSLDTSSNNNVETTCQSLQEALGRGRMLQFGLQVAIVRRVNDGKSSLLNVWSQSEVAIVAGLPGTTMDIVEAGVVVGGIMVHLLGTVGVHDAVNIV